MTEEQKSELTDLGHAAMLMDVMLSLVETVGSERARAMAHGLVRTARLGHVRHTRGLPLLIDGVDCSPENVRRLERERDYYKTKYTGSEEQS